MAKLETLTGKELEEFEAVIKRLGLKYCDSYKFGLYDRDDIYQEISLACWEAYPKWDKVRSLYKFMQCVIQTRVRDNLKRNKWYRPTCPCSKCDKCKDGETKHRDKRYCKKFIKWRNRNNTKCNLAAPPSIDDNYDALVDLSPDFEMSSKELINLIDEQLPVSMRETYLKMKQGVTVKQSDKQVVMDFLKNFLSKYN